jgi:pyrimidine-specific ribonucleoside hydrolase
MDGFFAFPEPWRKQADTLSGVAIPDSQRPVSKKHAVEVIHETLAAAQAPVVVLTTGSLTNIAQLLEKYPEDRDKISRLVIMGGSFDAPGNIIVPGFTDGHPNKWAEWNIYVDPIAADQVFASGLAMEVIGLDVTNLVKVTTEFAKDFKQRVATPASDFWDKVLDDNGWFIDSGEYYFWDVLAALVVINPEFCQGDMQPVYVTYETIAEPSKWTDQTITPTRIDGSKRNHFAPGKSGITKIGGERKPAKVCRKTDPALAFEVFTKTLNKTL